MPIYILITIDGRKTTATRFTKDTAIRATARCNPEDKCNEYYGAALAVARLYHCEDAVRHPDAAAVLDRDEYEELLEEAQKAAELRIAYSNLNTKYEALRAALRAELGRDVK